MHPLYVSWESESDVKLHFVERKCDPLMRFREKWWETRRISRRERREETRLLPLFQAWCVSIVYRSFQISSRSHWDAGEFMYLAPGRDCATFTVSCAYTSRAKERKQCYVRARRKKLRYRRERLPIRSRRNRNSIKKRKSKGTYSRIFL